MKTRFVALLILLLTTSISAHIMVSPPQSKSGAMQKYELRVHNEGKVAATAVELEIPDGLTVTEVATPAAGSFTTKTTGDRITAVAWKVDVQPSKYVALTFTAKNPEGSKEIHWNVQEHLADGSVVNWSDKPGAKEKASVTKIQ